MLSFNQRQLKTAVENDNVALAKVYLDQGADPNFFYGQSETPLMEAIRNHNIKMVRLLIHNGADINLSRPGAPTPMDVAEDMADILNDYSVYDYLRRKKAKPESELNKGAKPSAKAAKKTAADENTTDAPKPFYTKDNLKDIFNPESWVGKAEDMKKAWHDVPGRLKKDFDFEAVLAEARRQTLKKKAGGFKKPPVL